MESMGAVMSWFYSKNGTQLGPVTEQELSAKAGSGEVLASDLIWKEGMGDWKPLGQVTEFSGVVSQMPPAVNSPTPGNVPMAQPPAYSSSQIQPNIPNYLWQSIVATVLCCMPFGVVAIVFSAKVDGLVARGDIAGANAASKSAKNWMIAAAASGGAIVLIYVVMVIIAASSGNL